MNLTIGSVVEPWGKIGAMLITCGEPYYMLTKDGVVSLLPAKMVQFHARNQGVTDEAQVQETHQEA